MFSYLPHTDADIAAMLAVIGAAAPRAGSGVLERLEQLFADVPESLRLKKPLRLPPGLPECQVYSRLRALAQENRTDYVSFLGCGSYDHLIPAVVGQILGRSEFYTSYTPYQAEMSQGILQAIFEFQTMMCELTGLEVSNASLYDGHTAACEAAGMALNSVRRSDTILYSATLHPFTRQVLRTHFSGLPVKLTEIPARGGVTDRQELERLLAPGVAVVLLQSPNLYGIIEDLDGLAEQVHGNGSLLVLSANPLSLGVLRPPGQWGADIAVGDTQALGLPSYFGGPSVGYITAAQPLLHKMPGRIAGQAADRQGRRAYLLTLQAREQHIKRERATSNICSNQALAALAATVYLACLGREGFRELGLHNLQKARYLFDRLVAETALRPLYGGQPFFNEFALSLPRPAAEVLQRMEGEGILAGIDLRRLEPALPAEGLLVAVTEKRTRAELDRYVETMRRVLR